MKYDVGVKAMQTLIALALALVGTCISASDIPPTVQSADNKAASTTYHKNDAIISATTDAEITKQLENAESVLMVCNLCVFFTDVDFPECG